MTDSRAMMMIWWWVDPCFCLVWRIDHVGVLSCHSADLTRDLAHPCNPPVSLTRFFASSQVESSQQDPICWSDLLINDIWAHVTSFLSTRHKANLRQTCKRLRLIVNASVTHLKASESFFRQLLNLHLSVSSQPSNAACPQTDPLLQVDPSSPGSVLSWGLAKSFPASTCLEITKPGHHDKLCDSAFAQVGTPPPPASWEQQQQQQIRRTPPWSPNQTPAPHPVPSISDPFIPTVSSLSPTSSPSELGWRQSTSSAARSSR